MCREPSPASGRHVAMRGPAALAGALGPAHLPWGQETPAITAGVTGPRDLPAASDMPGRTKLIYVCFSLSGGFCQHR